MIRKEAESEDAVMDEKENSAETNNVNGEGM